MSDLGTPSEQRREVLERLDRMEKALDGLAEVVDGLAESLHPSVLRPLEARSESPERGVE